MTVYYKDFVGLILQLLQDNMGTSFGISAFYEGDPVIIGSSSLPAICVLKQDAKNSAGPTGFDQVDSTYLIKLIVDKRDDYGASTKTDLTDKRLRQMIEGRDNTTGLYVPESLMGILRKNFTLNQDLFVGNPQINQEIQVKYHLVDRSSKVDDTMITMEGHLTVNVTELVQIPNRV